MTKNKTTDVLQMMKWDREKDPELQRLYEEEKLKYEIALMIRDFREKLGLTQAQLAKKIGTSQSTIARLEDTDYEGYSMKTLQRIADALKCRLIIKFEPLSPAA